MPLADERAQLVGGEVETVEVGQAVLSLDFIDSELDFAESVVFVGLEISEGNLEDTALQCVVRRFETSRSVDQGLADTVDYDVRILFPMRLSPIFPSPFYFVVGVRTLVG